MNPYEYMAIEKQALAIALEADPRVSISACSQHLDAIGERVKEHLDGERVVSSFCEAVYDRLGYGPAEDYDDPVVNQLPDVLQLRRASPIGMSVLLLALARRLEVIIEPIAFPGHFLVRMREGPDAEPIYVDPLTGGQPLRRDRLYSLALEATGDARTAEHVLEPVGPTTVIVRLLLNLRRIYRLRGDHMQGMLISDRLFDLTTAPFHLADRGAHALALGATRAALADFDAYLAAYPTARDRDRVQDVRNRAFALLSGTVGPN